MFILLATILQGFIGRTQDVKPEKKPKPFSSGEMKAAVIPRGLKVVCLGVSQSVTSSSKLLLSSQEHYSHTLIVSQRLCPSAMCGMLTSHVRGMPVAFRLCSRIGQRQYEEEWLRC